MTGIRALVLSRLDEIDIGIARGESNDSPLNLYLIGSAAMILAYGLDRGTTDIDLIGRADDPELLRLIRDDATSRPTRSRAPISIHHVDEAIAGLRPIFKTRVIEIEPGRWRQIRVFVPDALDLILSKISRFSATDRQDIQLLCISTSDPVDPSTLRSRFLDHFDWEIGDNPQLGERLERIVDYLSGRIAVL